MGYRPKKCFESHKSQACTCERFILMADPGKGPLPLFLEKKFFFKKMLKFNIAPCVSRCKKPLCGLSVYNSQ